MNGASDMLAPAPEDVAAEWFCLLAEAKPEDRAAVERKFRQWLDADPRNAEAFASVSTVWDAIGQHAAEPEMVTLRQAALADVRNSARARWRASPLPRWSIAAMAYAAAALLVIGGFYYVSSMRPEGKLYTTQIGQREALTLADNSHVDIDADSAVSIALMRNVRLIRVQRGQAYFQVAHDRARPFIVEANGERVIATGTAFNVEALGNGVRVTLVEGHVTVRNAPDAPASLDADTGTVVAKLSPGDQLTDIRGEVAHLDSPANLLNATAWREGKLIFDNEKLFDVVARMKHYSHTEVVVSDPAIANLRVSGVFNAGDIPALVDALKRFFPIEAYSDGPDQVRLTLRK
jgi:transmembrane sensor